MRFYLAAAVLAASLSAPAAADRFGSSGSDDVRVHRGDSLSRLDRDRGDRRDQRGSDGDTFFPYRDYQGDTLWRPESFNDWWHERSDRAFPAWVARNRDCQRLYWSGGGWRC